MQKDEIRFSKGKYAISSSNTSINSVVSGYILNNTKILKIEEKLRKLENKIKKTLELTPQAIMSLKERLSKLRPIKQTHVKDTGDSIDEINEKSEVGESLFQGDMVLTEKQAEEVKEDVEEEIAEGNRTKRQAFKDRRYPNTIWSNGVNYYFDYSAQKCKGDPRAAKCYMGGVPHPRDCSKCLCPGGYGGKLCNERPSGCGDVLQATKEYSDLSKTIGNPNMQEREDFEICNYWIESPANTQIEVRIDTLNGNFAVDGCAYFGVEIKTQKDQKATGYR
ncbi:hypothetical protein ANCDUO_06020 [Ancylostoma duodenale]|uniref:CUB domain-containing protein n=1 Tax=Ancylostoma duodenale TaxID=51022 RepID=A0A0C2GX80_9BILA|nr:hypothetical protein ANCDUO_06020 [Ancylostoma duodenale]